MFRSVRPQSSISDRELEGGMRALVLDGVFIQSHTVLTTGAFLIGFALALGASNSVIGVLAALGPLALAFQIPAVYLVQRLRWRKGIVLVAATLSRSMWLVMAAIPFVLERRLQIPVFLGALMVHYTLGNIGGCAFNSEIRALTPPPD
ncbi:MAG TPA: MFS transporter, partial [Candidatus Hydrogenedentes bacterium]|nr:MFS transporter [Candidatus Hydrogenedentota bacterium]